MTNHGEYEVICTKVDRLTEEIRMLQQAVKHLKPPAEEESEEAWKNLIKLSENDIKKVKGVINHGEGHY